jgi:hypothetical protein
MIGFVDKAQQGPDLIETETEFTAAPDEFKSFRMFEII